MTYRAFNLKLLYGYDIPANYSVYDSCVKELLFVSDQYGIQTFKVERQVLEQPVGTISWNNFGQFQIS